jgi:hypothetical protein
VEEAYKHLLVLIFSKGPIDPSFHSIIYGASGNSMDNIGRGRAGSKRPVESNETINESKKAREWNQSVSLVE